MYLHVLFLKLNISSRFKFLRFLEISSSGFKNLELFIWASNAENLTRNPKIRISIIRRTLGVSVRKVDVLVLYRTVTLAGCEDHIKLKNVVRGNVRLMYDMTCGTYGYHCASKGIMFLASCWSLEWHRRINSLRGFGFTDSQGCGNVTLLWLHLSEHVQPSKVSFPSCKASVFEYVW
jgi:hypothetical protein